MINLNKIKSSLTWIFRSPYGVLVGVFAGVLTGIYYPSFGKEFGIGGDAFISLLKMCVMPILMTSVALSLMHVIVSKSQISIKKVASIFVCFMILTSALGMTVAILTQPGYKIDTSASKELHEVSVKSANTDKAIDEPLEPKAKEGILKFLIKQFPSNIFGSIAKDEFLQVLIFSIILGVTLAFVETEHREKVSSLMNAIRELFELIVDGISYLLPIAIFLILSKDLNAYGPKTLLGMADFIFGALLAFLILFVINAIIIGYSTGFGIFSSLAALRTPLIISFVTQTGVAAIPSTIDALISKLSLDKTKVNLLTSMGIVTGQFGTILYFAFSAIFVTQFYGVDLTIQSYLFIILASCLASLSSIGSHGALILTALGIILDPLGLPSGAVYVLFAAVDTVIEPFRSLLLVQTNCSILSIVANKKKLGHKVKSKPI